jgi:hypothetical protein
MIEGDLHLHLFLSKLGSLAHIPSRALNLFSEASLSIITSTYFVQILHIQTSRLLNLLSIKVITLLGHALPSAVGVIQP